MIMASAKLNINTATPEELAKLYKIGAKGVATIERIREAKLKAGEFAVLLDFHEHPALQSAIHHLIEIGELTDGNPEAYKTSGEQPTSAVSGDMGQQLMLMMKQLNRRFDEQKDLQVKSYRELEERFDAKLEKALSKMVVQEEKPVSLHMAGAIPKTPAAPSAKVPVVAKLERLPATPMRESADQSFISSVGSFLRSNAPPVPVRLTKQKPAAQDVRQRSSDRDASRESGSVEREEDSQRNPEGSSRPSRSTERFSSRKLFSPKIQHYDGKDDFKSFLVKIELLAEAYSWNDHEKLIILAQNLTGKPLDIFSKQKPEDRRNFQVSTEKLLGTFGKDDSPPVLRTQLMAVRQGEEERTDDFGQRVMQLVFQAYPDASPSMVDTLGIESFMRGANDKYAVEIAMIREPKTLTEAINFTKVAQSNHALLQGPRGKLRQVTFEDEHKVRRVQDDNSKGEEGDFKSTLSAMMSLLQKINSAVQPPSKVSLPTSDSPKRYSTHRLEARIGPMSIGIQRDRSLLQE